LKIELPMAMPSIAMGINQTIMLAFSMVVIAGFIGSGGLGEVIISGIQRYSLVSALEAGLTVVFLAIILDRITKSIGAKYKVEAD
jgi:glycine betaine/proline transport system permease protein